MRTACPSCGGTIWNAIVPVRWANFGGVTAVACAACGLEAVSDLGGVTPVGTRRVPENVAIPLVDLRFEPLPDAPQGKRVTHVPTGISVAARAYDSESANVEAALESIALQLRDAERRADDA